jgi:hypothetical protein
MLLYYHDHPAQFETLEDEREGIMTEIEAKIDRFEDVDPPIRSKLILSRIESKFKIEADSVKKACTWCTYLRSRYRTLLRRRIMSSRSCSA